jgi:hypothetical protein
LLDRFLSPQGHRGSLLNGELYRLGILIAVGSCSSPRLRWWQGADGSRDKGHDRHLTRPA